MGVPLGPSGLATKPDRYTLCERWLS